jgi:hypothetical protein
MGPSFEIAGKITAMAAPGYPRDGRRDRFTTYARFDRRNIT